MIAIKENQTIDVEALKQVLLSRKTITPRFRLPMTYEQARAALLSAYMAEVEYRYCTFVPDADTSAHISAAARWLTGDNAKPGLFLCGKCGNGKTTLIHAIKSLINWVCSDDSLDAQHYLKIENARSITDLAKQKSPDYTKLLCVEMLAIDELGSEPSEVLEYGNVINPTIDLLTHRYERRLFTIATSNLAPKDIEHHYGERIADRFREMMVTIPFDNDSFRK